MKPRQRDKAWYEVVASLLLLGGLVAVIVAVQDLRREILPGADPLALDFSRLTGPEYMELEEETEDPSRLAQRSERLHREAREARAAGQLEDALSFIEEARELQNRINRNTPGSRFADRLRSTSLAREAQNWRAEPVHEAALAAREKAEEAMSQQDYSAATTHLEEAIDQVQVLNRDHARSTYYNPNLMRALQSQRAELQTLPLVHRRDQALEEAREAVEEQAMERAEERFLEARQLQDSINLDFTDSPHASEVRWQEIERERQTLMSRGLAQELQNLFTQGQQAVQKSRWAEAADYLAEAEQTRRTLERDFPESEEMPVSLLEAMDFLQSVEVDRQVLVDQILGRLQPLDDEISPKLYAKEVSQALYHQVMGQNPSRQRDEELPVDSVSWSEAQAFCERLAILLAREVRLPREEEFRRALGSLHSEDLADRVWSQENSGGQSQPVARREANDAGFYDLLGNLAEWLLDEDGSNRRIIGGHYNSSLSELREVPTDSRSESYRSRTLGFRFVVEES